MLMRAVRSPALLPADDLVKRGWEVTHVRKLSQVRMLCYACCTKHAALSMLSLVTGVTHVRMLCLC